MQLSPSRETASRSATQEFRNSICNRKCLVLFKWTVPWSLPWATWIQYISPYPISLRSILILLAHLRFVLRSGLFPSGVATKTICAFILSKMHATFPAHMVLLDWIPLIIFARVFVMSRPQWPHSLRQELFSLARTLRSWVRIPFRAWMFGVCVCVVCVCAVLCLGTGLATGWSLVQGVYRLWKVITELKKRPGPWMASKSHWKKKNSYEAHHSPPSYYVIRNLQTGINYEAVSI
jgi:hypothetical protein